MRDQAARQLQEVLLRAVTQGPFYLFAQRKMERLHPIPGNELRLWNMKKAGIRIIQGLHLIGQFQKESFGVAVA